MRLLMTLLLVVAVALSVYNTVALRRLQAELATARKGVVQKAVAQPSEQERARELLRKADEHFARARDLMRKGRLDAALRETQKSKDLIDQAKAATSSDLVAQVRASTGKAATLLEDLLARFKGKPRPEAP